MNKLEYEARLNKTYNGTVTPVTRYTNQHATMCYSTVISAVLSSITRLGI